MFIGLDAREIQNGVITGIGRSLSNFIKYFGNNEFRHNLILFSERELSIKNKNSNIRNVTLKAGSTFLWDQLELPKYLKNFNIDLFYSPYYKIPFFSNIPTVSQILDLMFLIHPHYKKNLTLFQRFFYASVGRAFARKSLSIITDSEHAKYDIIKLWNVNPKKIVVIPLGLAKFYEPVRDRKLLFQVQKKFGLPKKYILYLGNFKPHKNVSSLIKAFEIVEKKFPKYKLVLAGTLDKHGEQIKNYVVRQGLENKVIFTNTVTVKDHPEAIFSMADVFVFPTLYEGFGLPPLEAMACGTAVVASNRTSVPEVIGDAGVLIDPLNIEQLSGAISNLLENPEIRAIYSKKGIQRAQRFKERNTAGRLYEHIISLLEGIK